MKICDLGAEAASELQHHVAILDDNLVNVTSDEETMFSEGKPTSYKDLIGTKIHERPQHNVKLCPKYAQYFKNWFSAIAQPYLDE